MSAAAKTAAYLRYIIASASHGYSEAAALLKLGQKSADLDAVDLSYKGGKIVAVVIGSPKVAYELLCDNCCRASAAAQETHTREDMSLEGDPCLRLEPEAVIVDIAEVSSRLHAFGSHHMGICRCIAEAEAASIGGNCCIYSISHPAVELAAPLLDDIIDDLAAAGRFGAAIAKIGKILKGRVMVDCQVDLIIYLGLGRQQSDVGNVYRADTAGFLPFRSPKAVGQI